MTATTMCGRSVFWGKRLDFGPHRADGAAHGVEQRRGASRHQLVGQELGDGHRIGQQLVLAVELGQGDETRPLLCGLLGQESGDPAFHVRSDRLHRARAVHHEDQQRRLRAPFALPFFGVVISSLPSGAASGGRAMPSATRRFPTTWTSSRAPTKE